ncbi:MAG: polysaccharide deacetylase family protein [Candidatus Aminicenantes bacterium]
MLSRINQFRSPSQPISITAYHSIHNFPDICTISPETFQRQMEFIHQHFSIIRLREIKKLMNAQDLSRKVVITFDDAFCDFHEFAYPVLEKHQIPATVFVPTGFIGKYNEWDFPFHTCHKRPVMDTVQLKELHRTGLVDFGSHTVDHVRLSGLRVEEMRRQASESRERLEDLLSTPVTMFSYPYGRLGEFSSLTSRILSETGYKIGVTTHWGTRNAPQDLLCLRRIRLKQKNSLRTIRSKIEGRCDCIFLLRARVMFGMRTLKGLFPSSGGKRKE